MDAEGRIASHTGSECVDWCGHIQGDGFSIAGNMLAGAAVLDDTAQAYLANARPAVRAAADRGDAGRRSRRRRQARQAIGGTADPRRRGMVRRSTCASTTMPIRWPNSSGSKQVSRERWVHFRPFLPTRKNPAGITDRATIDAGIEAGDGGQGMTASPLIEIEGLRVIFHGDDGRTTHAVDSVDLSVANGATLGLVGESGCGKSVTSLAIMGLLSKHSAEVSGSIRFDGFDLLDVPDETLRDLRGNRLAMIFQEPMTSLNPSFTIGDQIIETILRHRGGSQRQARERAIELLRRVHIPSPEQAHRRISAQALRRHAPARHDRDGAGLRSAPPDRGRADHRARRHPAGADPRSDARTEGRERRRDHPDHPRSRRGRRSLRRGRGDVCRRDRRARAGRRTVRQPAASLHRRPARLDPAARPPRRASGDHRGHGAEHGEPAARLPLRGALSVCHRDLHRRAAAADRRVRATPRAASGRRWRGWCHDRPARSRRAGEAFRRRAFGVRPADRLRQGGRRRQLHRRGRQDAGAGRRIRLRQIHREPAGAAADRAGRRQRPLRRPRPAARSTPTSCAPSAATRRSSSRTPTRRSTRA